MGFCSPRRRAEVAVGIDDLPDSVLQLIAQHVSRFKDRCANCRTPRAAHANTHDATPSTAQLAEETQCAKCCRHEPDTWSSLMSSCRHAPDQTAD